jgi:hypothetical protein
MCSEIRKMQELHVKKLDFLKDDTFQSGFLRLLSCLVAKDYTFHANTTSPFQPMIGYSTRGKTLCTLRLTYETIQLPVHSLSNTKLISLQIGNYFLAFDSLAFLVFSNFFSAN